MSGKPLLKEMSGNDGQEARGNRSWQNCTSAVWLSLYEIDNRLIERLNPVVHPQGDENFVPFCDTPRQQGGTLTGALPFGAGAGPCGRLLERRSSSALGSPGWA